MDNGSVTTTGLEEFKAAIEALTQEEQAEQRAVALRLGLKIRTAARANLVAATRADKTPETFAEKTAEAISVTVEDANRTVYVTSAGVSGDPANNPIWLEHGTVHEAAKPYMLPAVRQYEGEYQSETQRASDRVAQRLFGS
jgi:HK97 gp10 family phage protein